MIRMTFLAAVAAVACGLPLSQARAGHGASTDACCGEIVEPCCEKPGLLKRLFGRKTIDCCELGPCCTPVVPASSCCDSCEPDCYAKKGLLGGLFKKKKNDCCEEIAPCCDGAPIIGHPVMAHPAPQAAPAVQPAPQHASQAAQPAPQPVPHHVAHPIPAPHFAGDICCAPVCDECDKPGLFGRLFKKKNKDCCEEIAPCCEPAPAPAPCCEPICEEECRRPGLLSRLFNKKKNDCCEEIAPCCEPAPVISCDPCCEKPRRKGLFEGLFKKKGDCCEEIAPCCDGGPVMMHHSAHAPVHAAPAPAAAPAAAPMK